MKMKAALTTFNNSYNIYSHLYYLNILEGSYRTPSESDVRSRADRKIGETCNSGKVYAKPELSVDIILVPRNTCYKNQNAVLTLNIYFQISNFNEIRNSIMNR